MNKRCEYNIRRSIISTEGLEASNSSCDDERMDIVGSLIRVNSFKIADMSNDSVLVRDTISTKNIATFTTNGESLSTVVSLDYGNHFRSDFALIL
jgi:hypothetical protein